LLSWPIIPQKSILNKLYEVIDPTTKNSQGPDKGTQYRTGIYYTNPEHQEVIKKSLQDLQKRYKDPIVTENLPLKNYYKAEEYHQKYLDKNPGGYCHIPADKF
jgi:methionine-S-sulfoxide reductase